MMFKSLTLLFGMLALVIFVALSGCDQSGKAPFKPNEGVPESAGDAQAGHNHDAETKHADAASAEYRAELAKLSPEDRKIAEKQKVCPVSGEPLGSMGVPYKLTVKGRTVFLCCQGCEGSIKKDPDKYLARLPR